MPRKFSRKRSRKSSKASSAKYVKCPHCDAKYTDSRQVISIGPKKFFTTVTRRLYGCYNCKKILGLGSKTYADV